MDLIRATQEAIAEALGIRRTTVNLIAQQLDREGIITCGRGKITIRNRGALESSACECYSVLGQHHWPCELLRASDPSVRNERPGALSVRM
jgi:Mn-dependent DtxR family transcriptional regulator